MAESAIPVDLFNPGQVFACLGFLEATETLVGDAEATFEWSDGGATQFYIRSAGKEPPVEMVLRFLAAADVASLTPAGSEKSTAKWNVPTAMLRPGAPFPSPEPSSPATLPAQVYVSGKSLDLDHWCDESTRDKVKLWAGAAGYPGAALATDALTLIRGRTDEALADPFGLSAPQSSSFRFDWRRDYTPMDAGFSPNDHSHIQMVGYPLVEILAVIGLSHARPQRLTKLDYRYGAVSGQEAGWLPAPFLRAALGCAELPFSQRIFRMHLGWPGKENQARCILDVTEEPKN